MEVIFFLVGVPILLCMTAWVMVTAFRILRPPATLPPEKEAYLLRRQVGGVGLGVTVGEMRAEQGRQRHRLPPPAYHYAAGDSDGLPEGWHHDLWLRRN